MVTAASLSSIYVSSFSEYLFIIDNTKECFEGFLLWIKGWASVHSPVGEKVLLAYVFLEYCTIHFCNVAVAFLNVTTPLR